MKNIVFLQGPLGPFFKDLAAHFSSQGIETHKINFNGGDKFFSGADKVVDFTDGCEFWGDFFGDYLNQNAIDAVVVYGDCRKYHEIAGLICKDKNVDFWCFEEGYLRDGFVTLEKGGCNANSSLPRDPSDFSDVAPSPVESTHKVGRKFLRWMIYAIKYYLAIKCYAKFKHYSHHRPWKVHQEALNWIRNFYQKFEAKFRDPKVQRELLSQFDGKFYLVPLQTEVDFQMRKHSPFDSVSDFIETVIESFSRYGNSDEALLIKHHPQARGFIHYGKTIECLAVKYNLGERVFYGHDFRLPKIYRHTKGVVTVNSTVGLSALIHSLPTVVLGKAIYDIEGISFQEGLSKFWNAEKVEVNKCLFARFHCYLEKYTQLSGDFYKDTHPLVDAAYSKILG